MFKLSKERKVWWPVKLPVGNDAGEISHVLVRVLFRLLKADDMLALRTGTLAMAQETAQGNGIDTIVDRINASEREHTERLRAHVCDWRGVVDADTGDDVPFTPETLAMALEYADVRQAMSSGLREASMGAPAKN